MDSPSKEIRAQLDGTFFLSPEATAPFEFEVVYVPWSVPVAFIRMRPAWAPNQPRGTAEAHFR